MRSRATTILLVVVGLLAALSIFNFWKLRRTVLETGKGSQSSPVLDRVLSSGELRVGYLIQPPYLYKDTSTGKLSGIYFDVVENMAARLNLKVRWVEEVGLATLSEGLDSNRYDMIGFTLWRSAARSRNVAFSTPLFYSTLGIYVRADDSRFDGRISALNDPSVTIAAMDGELAADIARTDFPKAKLSSLPQFSDYTQLLLEITTKKADVTFFNKVVGARYMRQNPGKLKEVSEDSPIRVFAECFILPLRDPAFRSMIDSALLEMIENGQVDRYFVANGEDPNEYYRVARPFRPPVQ